LVPEFILDRSGFGEIGSNVRALGLMTVALLFFDLAGMLQLAGSNLLLDRTAVVRRDLPATVLCWVLHTACAIDQDGMPAHIAPVIPLPAAG
jgi:hypothetical protein